MTGRCCGSRGASGEGRLCGGAEALPRREGEGAAPRGPLAAGAARREHPTHPERSNLRAVALRLIVVRRRAGRRRRRAGPAPGSVYIWLTQAELKP